MGYETRNAVKNYFFGAESKLENLQSTSTTSFQVHIALGLFSKRNHVASVVRVK